jgi:hypothetical protein
MVRFCLIFYCLQTYDWVRKGALYCKKIFFQICFAPGSMGRYSASLFSFTEAGPVGDQKEKRLREKENFHRAILFHVQI